MQSFVICYSVSVNHNSRSRRKINENEMRNSLRRMKNGKAVGPDDRLIEIWKCL